MRVPHYAKRCFAALALTALVVGCGGDSTAPDAPFDASGTSSDIGALEASFDSPATASFAAASVAISDVLGASPAAAAVKAMPTKALVTGGKSYSTAVAKAYARPGGGISPSFSTAAVPAEYLGVTFTRDAETLEYGPSDLAGAPADGVRFMVYAVNPISGVVITPLVEVGYADIVTTETTSAVTVRIELVAANVTYLDYSVGITGAGTSGTVTVSGFVSNGDDRVDFDLDMHVTASSFVADFALTVPTRNGFRIDFEGEITFDDEMTETQVTSTLEARGPHGTVTISGTATGTSASYEVEVNGDLFATIVHTQGGNPVITGADGQPLSAEELEALQDVFAVFVQGFDFAADLLEPLPTV